MRPLTLLATLTVLSAVTTFGVAPVIAGAALSTVLETPSAPSGFRVAVFASGLAAPRAMAIDPAGTLLTSIPIEGRIVALVDRRGQGIADRVVTVASNLRLPHGLAFARGRLYVAETGRVLSFRYDPATLTVSDSSIVVDHLPAGGHHWTRTVAFGPDGDLYVAIGSSCDICRERDARRAAIVRYAFDGSRERIFATGLRNPVGLAFHPESGTLWTTVNERDWPGGAAPPDYVTAVKEGASYGWPDCFVQNGTSMNDPEFRGHGDCGKVTLPTLEIPPHSAPLGLAFYTGRQFPPSFRGSLFVALHGSRAGLTPAGDKIIRVRLDAERVIGIEDFSTQWRTDTRIVGRPVDIVVGRDGSLYVSDDHAGRIYLVTFGPGGRAVSKSSPMK